MLERPGADELLEAARAAALELLPHLPDARRVEARMIAGAIAIALRERRDDAAWQGTLVGRLQVLLDAPGVPDAAALLRRFAAAIRAGAFDPGTPWHAAAAEVLRDLGRGRAAVSAPRALG